MTALSDTELTRTQCGIDPLEGSAEDCVQVSAEVHAPASMNGELTWTKIALATL